MIILMLAIVFLVAGLVLLRLAIDDLAWMERGAIAWTLHLTVDSAGITFAAIAITAGSPALLHLVNHA